MRDTSMRDGPASIRVRLADADVDAEGVAEVYRPSVETSVASFEAEAPDAEEMAARIRRTLSRAPWLVAVAAGRVVGYGYASGHGERAAYRWSVNVSAYVHPDWRGRGVGRALYRALFEALVAQQFVNVYAGIALPNDASVRLHQSVGMELIGVYRNVGYKFGRWHDVGWYGVRLREPANPPAEPTLLPDLVVSPVGLAWLDGMAGEAGQPR